MIFQDQKFYYPMDTGRKFNVRTALRHVTPNVVYTLNFRPCLEGKYSSQDFIKKCRALSDDNPSNRYIY